MSNQNKSISALAGICLLLTAFNFSGNQTPVAAAAADTATLDGHPAWIEQGNIYEVNVRQYTPEGTFTAFAKNLDRLKEMGVQTLWFMPIQPISNVDRKGILGSYYAVSDYTGVNPEFGTLTDWKNLVKEAHEKGFKVIIDWVPNHTGGDHYWLLKHPDFYVIDSATGKAKMAADWSDTRKLNYANPVLVDSMINSLKFWLLQTNIDGFRCDVAGDVPDAFWQKAIAELKKAKPGSFFLAEADKPSLHTDGFDASYPWEFFAISKKVAAGERPAFALDSVLNKYDSTYPKNYLKLWFTSNHDENSWNKADYGTMPGASHAPFAVLTQTLPHAAPLIYSGQEEPYLDSISFFYKDTIKFEKFARAPFYKTLLQLRKDNPALASNASFKKVNAGNPKQVYAFVREKGSNKVLVITNLSAKEATISLKDETLKGKAANVFNHNSEDPTASDWKIEPWGYAVYVY
jgi:glycosidase